MVVDVVFRRLSVREALSRGAWLYRPIAIVAVFAILDVAGQLARSATAGFNIPGMRWYEYLFTQFRVWPLYLGLAVLPFRQNADYDIALSQAWPSMARDWHWQPCSLLRSQPGAYANAFLCCSVAR